MRPCLLLLAMGLAIVADATASGATAESPSVEMQPHRAIYSLKLAGSEFGSGIADASGTMAFEWAESCENWIIQQKAMFDVFGPEGTPVRTEVTFTSWESKVGDEMGFSLRTLQDDELIEDLRGKATFDPAGSGKAVYTRPAPREVALPPGTVFSAAHTIMLIRAAQAGDRKLFVPVFLGQRDDEPMTVSAIISPQPAHTLPGSDRWDILRNRQAWRVHLAFYGTGDEVSPSFEVHETLYANGIVGTATVLYDKFSFAYTLDRLETLPAPKC